MRALLLAGAASVASLFAVGAGVLRAAPARGAVSGRLDAPERTLARAGNAIVFLEPRGGGKAGSAEAPRKHVVRQRDAKFVPSFLVIARGDTVAFTNDEVEALEHNVYSFSEVKKFDLGLFGSNGETRDVTFDSAAGEVSIFCSVHKFMEATIYVAPTAYHARVDAAGKFTLSDVPAGEWTLRTWHSSKRYADEVLAITVKEDATATVTVPFGRRQ